MQWAWISRKHLTSNLPELLALNTVNFIWIGSNFNFGMIRSTRKCPMIRNLFVFYRLKILNMLSNNIIRCEKNFFQSPMNDDEWKFTSHEMSNEQDEHMMFSLSQRKNNLSLFRCDSERPILISNTTINQPAIWKKW